MVELGLTMLLVGIGCGEKDGDDAGDDATTGAGTTSSADDPGGGDGATSSGESTGSGDSSGTTTSTAGESTGGTGTSTGSAGTGPGGGCPQDGVRGKGTHRVFAQGSQADPDENGIYPFLHEWEEGGADALLCDDAVFVNDTNGDGIWQPGEAPKDLGPAALVHGEHYLVGAGAFVEFAITLCDDITGNVAFYIPNFDEDGSEALHQLFVVHEGEEFLIAETIDNEAGMNGYNPFIRVIQGNDPDVVPGDQLKMRSTNLNGIPFSVMIFAPPSEYESWVLVEVP